MSKSNHIDISKRVNNLDNVVVTGGVISKILGVSERQVRNLSKSGVLPKLPNGSYDLIQSLNQYIANIKQDAEKEKHEIKGTASYEKEKLLHERAKREKAELIVGQMRGELHESYVVEKVMTEMLSNMRAKLLGLPTKVAPILIARSDIAIIEEILKKEIYEVLTELSDYDPEEFQNTLYIESVEEDDEVE